MSAQKITLEKLRADMRIFLDFPRVEESLRLQVADTVGRIMLSKAQNGGRPQADVLAEYLDAGARAEERLKFIIGISGGSLERMKRVYAAMFPGTPWSAMKHDKNVRRRTAEFLLNPASEKTFIPSFVADSFALPPNWIQLLRDEAYLRAVAHNLAQSKYAVAAGVALEESARAVVAQCGHDSAKGPVAVVDNKEVDIAAPNLENPRVLIMSSYQLTTSSSQSSKANEQARMYQDVQTFNRSRRRRGSPEILFVNVIDGGGWLERASDLETMWRECDHCFARSGLRGLKDILRRQFVENRL